MKIIKFGDKVRQETCPECGCIFEYDNNDEILENNGCRTIKCPDCLFAINIDKKTAVFEFFPSTTHHKCPICKEPLIRIDSNTSALAKPYKCTSCGLIFSTNDLTGILTTAEQQRIKGDDND